MSNVRLLSGRRPAEFTGKTADAVRELLKWVRDDVPGWAYQEVAQSIPPRAVLGPCTPPLFELCWSSSPDDIWVQCDRQAFHKGPCTWATTHLSH